MDETAASFGVDAQLIGHFLRSHGVGHLTLFLRLSGFFSILLLLPILALP